MISKTISLREARELQKRVALLEAREEDRRSAWVKDYPGGTHIGSVVLSEADAARIRTARLLSHAIFATCVNGFEINFYALPIAEESKA